MRLILLSAMVVMAGDVSVQVWMENAFYPVLIGILIIASLGVPIPEDVPLIAAGVILKTNPGVGSFLGAFLAALCGIMIGDLVLYTLGKRWGRDVVRHRWVRSLITAERFDLMADRFHRWGAWMCFFGRFFMGIRGVMCITAGATRYPYWRFFLADFCGALLSVPFFIFLGYWFADKMPALRAYIGRFQNVTIALIVVAVAAFIFYELRKIRRTRRINIEYAKTHPPQPEPESPPQSEARNEQQPKVEAAVNPKRAATEKG